MTTEYARIRRVNSYRELCPGIYNTDNPVVGRGILLLWDIMVLLTAIIGGGGCVAGCGTLAKDVLGIPYLWGCAAFIVGMFALICFGSDVLKRLSKVGVVLILVFFAIVTTGLIKNFPRLIEVMTTDLGAPVVEVSMKTLLISGITYGVAQSSFFQTSCIIAKDFQTQMDTRKFIIWGFIFNCGAMLVSYLCLMSLYPAIGESQIPIMGVVQNFSGISGLVLTLAYYVVLVLAYVTTVASVLVGVIARYTPVLGKAVMSERGCRVIILFLILGLNAVLSTLGLDGVLLKGNSFNATLRTPVWVVPILILRPLAIAKAKKLKKENSL